MRIVSGYLGGRTIKAVPGNNTRPTLDKVKESIFNILGQYFDNGVGLDLYAGSGNLGIEAISRGLDSCIFVDNNLKAYQVIKENIKALNIEEICKTYKLDAFKALNQFKGVYKFDLVFLDPPYDKQKNNEILTLLEDQELLNPNATIVIESLKEDQFINSYKTIEKEREYIYGISKITIFQKKGELNE